MVNIALGCAYSFRHHLKAALRNENKIVINLATTRCNNTFIVSVRNVMSMAEEKDYDTQNIEIAITDTLSDDIKKYNLIKKKNIANIISNIYSINCVNSSDALLLLQSCNNVTDCLPLDKVKLGESLWSTLTVCNFNLNTAHYNALLKLYVENEYDFSPSQLLEIMKCNEIDANSITYKKCIELYCMKGKINKALKLLQDVERLGLSVSESTFNSILLGYSLFGKVKDINKILASMKQNKLQLTTETYVALMCACAKVNDMAKIRNILASCNLQNMYFTNRDILNVIYVLAKNGHIAQINTMYKYLKKKRKILYNEIQVILKLISVSPIYVAISALSYMSLNNDHPQCEDILKLILEHMINKRLLLSDIVQVCTFFTCEKIHKKLLLIVLYHSLMTNDRLSLPVLKLCKCHLVIKPHYFWPLLISHGSKYNFQGILDILKIMVHDFNVSPCVDTIVDYVLPFSFGDAMYIRSLLMQCRINETIINNAYVLSLLKQGKVRDAKLYIQDFHGKYFYKILARDLRQASVFTHSIYNFLYISSNLVHKEDFCLTLEADNESRNITFAPIDAQLYEVTIDLPYCKSWLTKVMREIARQKIRLHSKTIEIVGRFLCGHRTHNLMSLAQNVSNKKT